MKSTLLPHLLLSLASLASTTPLSLLARHTLKSTVDISIKQWQTDVNNVNAFLNDASTLHGTTLLSATKKTLNFANDEPKQLAILSKLPGLDADGQSGANLLGEIFLNVPIDLQNIIDNVDDAQAVTLAISEINNNRCLNVLPAASELWAAAAKSVGLAPPAPAGRPNACLDISPA